MYWLTHAIRKNGTAVLTAPSSASGRTYGRGPACGQRDVDAERERAGGHPQQDQRRGARSRSAISMNMKDEPQIAASPSSMIR